MCVLQEEIGIDGSVGSMFQSVPVLLEQVVELQVRTGITLRQTVP